MPFIVSNKLWSMIPTGLVMVRPLQLLERFKYLNYAATDLEGIALSHILRRLYNICTR